MVGSHPVWSGCCKWPLLVWPEALTTLELETMCHCAEKGPLILISPSTFASTLQSWKATMAIQVEKPNRKVQPLNTGVCSSSGNSDCRIGHASSSQSPCASPSEQQKEKARLPVPGNKTTAPTGEKQTGIRIPPIPEAAYLLSPHHFLGHSKGSFLKIF